MAADVAFGLFAVDQPLLGQLHGLGNRRQAEGILVDANTEVELRRIGVCSIRIEQTENRVAGHPCHVSELFHLRPSAFFATSSVRAAMMKSLRCRPLIEWLHQVTVTLPHSVSRPGW